MIFFSGYVNKLFWNNLMISSENSTGGADDLCNLHVKRAYVLVKA